MPGQQQVEESEEFIRCESLKFLDSWSRRVNDIRRRSASDGTLIGMSGKNAACGWSVLQLDYDEDQATVCQSMVKW